MKKYEVLLAQSDGDSFLPSTIRWTLERMGYQVTSVLGSNPGIEVLSKKSFDLIITDLVVVLEKAKELNPESMAVLMLTTGCRSILSVRAIRSIVDDYLFVPFELIELEERVANCIEKLKQKQRNACDHLDEKIENILKTLSYDMRGSLMSMTATLKLMTQGYYGEIDERIENHLKPLLAKTLFLTQVTEECLGEIWPVSSELKTVGKTMNGLPDMICPVSKDLPLGERQI